MEGGEGSGEGDLRKAENVKGERRQKGGIGRPKERGEKQSKESVRVATQWSGNSGGEVRKVWQED